MAFVGRRVLPLDKLRVGAPETLLEPGTRGTIVAGLAALAESGWGSPEEAGQVVDRRRALDKT